jgi:CheY-like chemotaxis protein
MTGWPDQAVCFHHLQISTHFVRKALPALRSSGKERRFAMENRTTVLYVDDNPKSSRLLSSVLEECGFRVIAKNDPIEALALCKRSYFDLALLDYEMPLMSGSRMAQEIKYLAPDVPVVLISGRTVLPAAELVFVDAHFGFGTSLDDLLWTMRILSHPRVVTMQDHPYNTGHHNVDQRADPSAMTRWADST